MSYQFIELQDISACLCDLLHAGNHRAAIHDLAVGSGALRSCTISNIDITANGLCEALPCAAASS